MKLVLYSDFKSNQTELVDERLLGLIGSPNPKIGYIPSDSDLKRKYFGKVTEHYADIGVFDVMYFDLKDEFQKERIPELLDCSAIHLSGGDPVLFLSLIRHRDFAPLFKKFLSRGGTLIGVSAGAMLLGPSLGLCDPSVKKALNFLDFEFFPHFDGSPSVQQKLCDYSLKTRRTIYACDDCDGLVVLDGCIECIGNVTKIEKGRVQDKNST